MRFKVIEDYERVIVNTLKSYFIVQYINAFDIF